jgi:hypothetical protein
MPVKYECPRCGRRFTEWGAEKHGFKCPGDEWCPEDRPEEIELVRMGTAEDRVGKRPSLKRHVKRPATVTAIPVQDDDEDLSSDVVDETDGDEGDENEVLLEDEEGLAADDSDDDANAGDSDESLADDEDADEVDSDGDLSLDDIAPSLDGERETSGKWAQ